MTLSLLAQAEPKNISLQVREFKIPDFAITADEAREML